MKHIDIKALRIFAAFTAGTALVWSCTVEDADTDTDYLSDLEYYSTILKTTVLDEAVYGGMEAMLKLNTYIGLSEQERGSEKWQEYSKTVSFKGNEVTLPSYVVNVKDGVPLMQEGAEWELSVSRYSYLDYYSSLLDPEHKTLSMTVKCVGDSLWTFSGSSDAAGQLYNLKFSGECALNRVSVQGLVTVKARVWTIGRMNGSTSEDSGYSSKFNASENYQYIVTENGAESESGIFSVDFFKDGALIGNTEDRREPQ